MATQQQRGRLPARGSVQWTLEQQAWLAARAQASGVESVAAVVRMIVQAAIESERQQQAEAV